MYKKSVKPFGSWESPVTSEYVAGQSISLNDMAIDGTDSYWTETRPSEKTINVIVKHEQSGNTFDITRYPFDVKTRIHEYGGGAFNARNGEIFFVNSSDQQIYKTNSLGVAPILITQTNYNCRYGDFIIDSLNENIISVREEHRDSGEIKNTIVLIALKSKICPEVIIAEGADFYSSPTLNPRGNKIAWIEWNHPNMPWDSTKLCEMDLSNLVNKQVNTIAGNDIEESICQPQYSPDGYLHFISDRNGWWNIYRFEKNNFINLWEIEAEFTQPQWNFGAKYYGFKSKDEIICAFNIKGYWDIAKIKISSKETSVFTNSYSELNRYGLRVSALFTLFAAGSALKFTSINSLNNSGNIKTLKEFHAFKITEEYISIPESISYPTSQKEMSHGFYYKPKNPLFQAPVNSQPPLIVMIHGGPTGSCSLVLDPYIQFWTTRGFSVLNVNYRGSTGYGTKYRKSIHQKWGIFDVDDCIYGASYLVKINAVDNNRISIKGSSSGAYTAFLCLARSNIFKAGISYYGVSNLKSILDETHKFESRYLDTLIGEYPKSIFKYTQRSPINNISEIDCPVLIFQGLQDKIVTPKQSQEIFNKLNNKGVPVGYLEFPNEGHGFRNTETIKMALSAEAFFYSLIYELNIPGSSPSFTLNNFDPNQTH